ncbi:hypothetical protein JCM11491_003432 [Sporobolomyces phaffii]
MVRTWQNGGKTSHVAERISASRAGTLVRARPRERGGARKPRTSNQFENATRDALADATDTTRVSVTVHVVRNATRKSYGPFALDGCTFEDRSIGWTTSSSVVLAERVPVTFRDTKGKAENASVKCALVASLVMCDTEPCEGDDDDNSDHIEDREAAALQDSSGSRSSANESESDADGGGSIQGEDEESDSRESVAADVSTESAASPLESHSFFKHKLSKARRERRRDVGLLPS